MGKKKSKTAKKKQAKAASRAKQAKAKTTAFGVSVVKGSKGRGGAAGGGGHGGNDHAASSVGHNMNMKGGGSGRSNASSSAHHNMQHDTTRRVVSRDDERNDFDRQHASLQERAEARQRQQKAGGKKHGNRKHQQQQQQQQQPQSSSLFANLAQSSIQLGPATVGEMVDDAADRVAAGMTAIGAALSPVGGTAGRPAAPPNTPSSTGGVGGSANMLQVLAAQKRQEWSAQKYMLQPESKAKDDQMGDNRFAGLDNWDSDSDDNGWGADGDQPVDAPPSFNFAPASFAFGQNNAAGAQQQPDGDDDPDL